MNSKPTPKRGRPQGRADRIQVSIALSPKTIARVDAAAKEQGMARAAYLRQKIMHMLHVEGL